MLPGRLGIETARIPHADRHGLIFLEHGKLLVEDGNLHFIAAQSRHMAAGNYSIPFQMISLFLLGPGTTVSHDALRLLARHGCGLMAIGEDGVRVYTSQPIGPNESALSRKQTIHWADLDKRLYIARKMYAIRLKEIFPEKNISVLRGIEGARMKEIYALLARKYQITWHGRKYDRNNPCAADLPNQAINHSATVVEAAASIAVASTGTIPQLGFTHEDSSNAFTLDIADLFRDTFTIPIAFQAVKLAEKNLAWTIDRHVRMLAGNIFREKKLISHMIDAIKDLFKDNEDDSCNYS